jgi:glycosyltransferase involved in cell wall biosynthesis
MQSTTTAAPDLSLEDLDRILEELDLESEVLEPDRPEGEGFALSGGILPGKVENRMPRLSILLPALNEEGGIHAVLRTIPEQSLRRMGFHPVVQLLDGGSTDRTRMVARDHGANVYVQKGWGKGSAFREFLPTLRSEYCVILDSDATYPAAWIPLFAETLRKGAPVVLGSRFKGKIEDGAMSSANQLGNRILSLFASLVYHRHVSDVCSGMWGFRTDVLQSLRITADGFDLEANLFAECVRRGIPIVEVAIPYSRRIGVAKLRVRTGLRIAWSLLVSRIRSPPQGHQEPQSAWDLLASFARKE